MEMPLGAQTPIFPFLSKVFFCFLFLNVLKIDICLKKIGEVDVPLAGAKQYGGQQLERLLAEFLAVSSRAEIAEPSLADVANAAGLNKVRYGGTCFVKKAFFFKKKKNLKSNSTDLAWSASDLAQHKSKVRKLFLFWNFFFSSRKRTHLLLWFVILLPAPLTFCAVVETLLVA